MADIIRDTLGEIIDHQLKLQRESFGIDPATLLPEERAAFVQAMALALTVEIGEALQEVSWKPWASADYFNPQPYLGELIDALHFLVNLMLVATTDSDEIVAAYYSKAKINAKRQADGYTGLDKCPTCGREHGDV